MKKILYLVMAIAIPVGLAIADESVPNSSIDEKLFTTNGITYFDVKEGVVCAHASDMGMEGSAAGGLSVGGGMALLDEGNGITAFDRGKRAVCTSGPAEPAPGKVIGNGITYFN